MTTKAVDFPPCSRKVASFTAMFVSRSPNNVTLHYLLGGSKRFRKAAQILFCPQSLPFVKLFSRIGCQT